MAIALDSQEVNNYAHNAVNSGSLSWPFSNAAGTLLIIGIVAANNTGGTGVTNTVSYGGQAMSKLGAQTWNLAQSEVSLWSLNNPPFGSNTVSVSASVSGLSNLMGGAISLTGMILSNPVGTITSSKNDTSLTTLATLNANTNAGDWLISAAGTGTSFLSGPFAIQYSREYQGLMAAGVSPTTVSAVLNVSNQNAGSNFVLGYQSSAGGSVPVSYNTANDFFGLISIGVKPIGAIDPEGGIDCINSSFEWNENIFA